MKNQRNLNETKILKRALRMHAQALQNLRNTPELELIEPGITAYTEETHQQLIKTLNKLD